MKKLSKVLFVILSISITVTMICTTPTVQAQILPADMTMIGTKNHEIAQPVDKYDNDRRNAPAQKITYKQAEEIALREVNGDYVKKIELEYKRHYSCWVYEVEVVKNQQKFEVYVSGETGEVLRVKRD